jgi:ParB family chromosome partitioning protein
MDNILGKGLSELLGGTPYNIIDKEVNLQELLIDVIEPGKYQPRNNFEEEELEGLTLSIKEKGVLQPIIVKFCQLLQKYEIVAGERRYRACKRAGIKTIPAIILDISDAEAYEVALIENIQRERLNPIEEATAILKLIDQYDYSQDDVAAKLGKSRAHINNMLRLLKLPAEVKQLLVNNKISMGHARTLINKENAYDLAQQIISNDM